MRQKHARQSPEQPPTSKRVKLTSWQQHLKEFGDTEGKINNSVPMLHSIMYGCGHYHADMLLYVYFKASQYYAIMSTRRHLDCTACVLMNDAV